MPYPAPPLIAPLSQKPMLYSISTKQMQRQEGFLIFIRKIQSEDLTRLKRIATTREADATYLVKN